MAQSDTYAGEAARVRERLAWLDAERAELERRLAELMRSTSMQPASANPDGTVTNRSPTSDKIALFRTLFRRPGGCVSPALGEHRERQGRIRASLR